MGVWVHEAVLVDAMCQGIKRILFLTTVSPNMIIAHYTHLSSYILLNILSFLFLSNLNPLPTAGRTYSLCMWSCFNRKKEDVRYSENFKLTDFGKGFELQKVKFAGKREGCTPPPTLNPPLCPVVTNILEQRYISSGFTPHSRRPSTLSVSL